MRTDLLLAAVLLGACTTMELRTLEAGAPARFSLRLPPGLAAGDYRYHTTVEMLDTGTRRDLRSGTLRVR